MKVWELIAALSKVPAGDEVCIGIGPTLNAETSYTESEEGFFIIRSDEDVEVCNSDGDTVFLSSLTEVDSND